MGATHCLLATYAKSSQSYSRWQQPDPRPWQPRIPLEETQMRNSLIPFAALAMITSPVVSQFQFEQPTRIEAGGKVIDIERGDIAPLYVDFDGDGVKDLLVGTFTPGDLRIYKNYGTDTKPAFREFEVLQAGGVAAKVPTG